ncbi:hypothetical protein LEP1GSC115_4715 [Leptospira interrogans serovar Australis str. 200703203]|uniref:Uncharacterized protein n=1 Tax=Leptospira interrogans serovar Australis str. 200703203 TaxID=1085541 RepID=N1V1D8_LEPIR|nr:hypothetical protein LEP1GSC115_4715 [Leptospira interrogans serovar Australis str. 200703203]
MQVLFKEVIFSVCCSIDPDSSWNFFCFFDPAFEVISFYRKIQSFSFKIDSDYFFRVGTTTLYFCDLSGKCGNYSKFTFSVDS